MDAKTYRALKLATALMGLLIVAGVVLLGVGLAHRQAPLRVAVIPATGTVLLHQPTGTRILGIATAGPNLAVALTGGGPDRVLLLDPITLRLRAEARFAP